jgi:hypothetical protein
MARLALGREAVALRAALPSGVRFGSDRVIPLEPDELWDAIDLQIRNQALLGRMEQASRVVAVGLQVELRKNRERLGLLLDRMTLDEQTFDTLLLDIPAIVQGVKLATLNTDEADDAMSIENSDDFVVSVKGRGFSFMTAYWVRADYTNAAGDVRSFPMQLTAFGSDLTMLEFSAGAPLSSFQVVEGSTVTLTMVLDLQSDRSVVRAFERFIVV